jgi:hypothetical protein
VRLAVTNFDPGSIASPTSTDLSPVYFSLVDTDDFYLARVAWLPDGFLGIQVTHLVRSGRE